MEITIDGIATNDMVMLLPNSFMGEGEAGEPLPVQVEVLINALASQGWWPVDFGAETGEGHTELWFALGDSVEQASEIARNFIRKGGYV